jgi:nucleotide-binding universal stress UspA family protein
MSLREGLRVGSVVDAFRVGEVFHAGGQGVLYAVERISGEDGGFPLLMKVPRLGPDEPGESVVTYEVERMVLSSLRGPHVPRFVAAGDLAAQPYLVMERVEGTSLADRPGPLPPAEVASLGAAVAEALQDVHAQRVIHHDVKPSNVILRPSGEAVLLDFGLSRHLHHPDLLGEEAHAPVGSAPYVSPEGVLRMRGDPRSDLFSLGAMLYELVTGELPFGSPVTEAGLRQRLWMDPLPPRARMPDTPEWLQEVILRCLEPDPADRHATAAEVAERLAHPERVVVTERGHRLKPAGSRRRLARGLRQLRHEPPAPAAAGLPETPVVLVALATEHTNELLKDALRREVRWLVAPGGAGWRLACVAIIPPPGPGSGRASTTERIKHLLLLRHWAEGLEVPAGQVSHHVIEAAEPAPALLEYVRRNHVAQVVIGAPPPDVALSGLLGTVAMKVMAEAPCTVTLVRPRS